MQQTTLTIDRPTSGFEWRSRLHAAGLHLVLSVLVAVLAGVLVFAVWFPYPYREVSGGIDLFRLVVAVDVVLGPLLTFAVFNRRKAGAELKRDLAVVVTLQLAALAYGMWSVAQARPVHMVFEYDRFRVVHRVEIPKELEHLAPAGIQAAPLGRPTLLSLRAFRDAGEQVEFTTAALGGVQLSARPELWQPYQDGRATILAAAKPVSHLISRFPQHAGEIERVLRTGRGEPTQAAYLPLVSRGPEAWTVLLDARTAEVIGYVPLDPF